MSASQFARYISFGFYKTAWLICHKVRTALVEGTEQLGVIVEVDETFAAAKTVRNISISAGTGGVGSGKVVVVGAVRRKGNVVARVVENVRASTLEGFVHEAVSHKLSLLITNQWVGNKHLGKEYPDTIVDHAKGEYVIGALHTNTIEGFWSIIKRGIVGSFRKVNKKYLPLYVAEFQFRYAIWRCRRTPRYSEKKSSASRPGANCSRCGRPTFSKRLSTIRSCSTPRGLRRGRRSKTACARS
jgi:transposase-like protein